MDTSHRNNVPPCEDDDDIWYWGYSIFVPHIPNTGYLKSDVGFFCFRVFEKGDCSKVFCGFFVFSVPWGKAVAVKFYVGFLSKGSLHSKSQASA